MSSELPLLTSAQLSRARIDGYQKWLDRPMLDMPVREFEDRAIEQAVRAQWAAEVDRQVSVARKEWALDWREKFAAMEAERDSAQAEAKESQRAHAETIGRLTANRVELDDCRRLLARVRLTLAAASSIAAHRDLIDIDALLGGD